MKFLLINPFMDYEIVKDIFAIESEVPPLGLIYLAASLEKEGYEVDVVDFCAEKFTQEKLINALTGVDAVGISIISHLKDSAKKIIDVIRKNNSDVKIIIGGPHCTLNPETALLETKADICVEGDGEIAIIKIAQALQKKINLSEIHGVFYFEDNQIKHGPPAEIMEDLDALPFPARRLIEKYKYGGIRGGLDLTRGRITSIMVSRGCPFNCTFCINRSIAKKYRSRSAENVIEELKEIKGKYDFLHVVDDIFFVDMKRANKILDFIIDNKCNFEIWISGIRVDTADMALFKKMRKAGVTTINIGIESGNQEVLNYYNKKTTLDQTRKAVHLARKAGFLTIGYFILGAPVEKEKELENTIRFAKSLPLDMAVFSPFSYLKGSPCWQDAFAEGKIKEGEYGVISDSNRDLGNFTVDELWNWCIKAFKEFHLNSKYILGQIVQAFIRRDFRIIFRGYKLILRKDNVLKYEIYKKD